MLETIKAVTLDTIMNKWLLNSDSNQQVTFDIVQETAQLYMKITLECLFGRDLKIHEVPQTYNDIEQKVPLGMALLKLIEGGM